MFEWENYSLYLHFTKICKKKIKNPHVENLTAIYLTEDNNIFRKINTHKVKRTRFR
jgi:hypothetical protein